MFSNFISMSFPDISSNEIKKNIDIDNFKLPITYLNNNELYPIPNNVSDDLELYNDSTTNIYYLYLNQKLLSLNTILNIGINIILIILHF